MELWIRSQDRENLVHPNYINIGGNKTDKYVIWGHNVLLGKYKSKKRALEVLDEIQLKIVINNGYVLATNSGIKPINLKPDYCAVYEMPEE